MQRKEDNCLDESLMIQLGTCRGEQDECLDCPVIIQLRSLNGEDDCLDDSVTIQLRALYDTCGRGKDNSFDGSVMI